MRRISGFTIVQIMVVLLVAGIVVWAAVEAFIDKRCADEPSRALCADRTATRSK